MCGIIRPWTEGRQVTDESHNPYQSRTRRFIEWLTELYGPFYVSVYQPVWMWERGRSKRNWIRQVLEDRYVAPTIITENPGVQGTQANTQSNFGLTHHTTQTNQIGDSGFLEGYTSSDVEAQRSLSAKKLAEIRKFDGTTRFLDILIRQISYPETPYLSQYY